MDLFSFVLSLLIFGNDSPRALELTASDELVAIENSEVLRANGFDVFVDEDAPAHERVKLVSHPVSKTTDFDLKGER
jgi:DNA mismatch repair protein PMS2